MKKLLLVLAILALLCVSTLVVAQEDNEYDVAEVDDAIDLDEADYDGAKPLNPKFKVWKKASDEAVETPETPNETELDDAEENEAEVDDALDLDEVEQVEEENVAEVDDALDMDELEGVTDAEADAAIDADIKATESKQTTTTTSNESHSEFRHWNLSLFAIVFICFGIVVGLSTVGYVIYKYRAKVKKQQKQLEREQQGALNTLTAEHVDQPYVLHVL
jgi:uncharacterized membrane protein YciS (DUF1049 family)